MAQRVNIVLVDDIDGTDAAETVTFGLDGVNYEIDLTDSNASALREAMAPYVGHARRVSGRRKSATGASSTSDAAQVREWARSSGHQVPDRGRIPADVRAAYNAAH